MTAIKYFPIKLFREVQQRTIKAAIEVICQKIRHVLAISKWWLSYKYSPTQNSTKTIELSPRISVSLERLKELTHFF